MHFLSPSTLGPPVAPYSQGVVAGSLVFLAGQMGLDANNEVVAPGDVRAQTAVAISRMRAVLAEAGLDLTDVVAATVYLTDVADFPAFNEAWSASFGDHRPARATVRADLTIPGGVVEIMAVASRGQDLI